MTKATYDDFDFIGYDRAGTNDTLVNDAHCIMAHSSNNPLVQGGGLPGVYQFAQYHLHWDQITNKDPNTQLMGNHIPWSFTWFITNYNMETILVQLLKTHLEPKTVWLY